MDYNPSLVYDFDLRAWVPVQSEATRLGGLSRMWRRGFTTRRLKVHGKWRTVHKARWGECVSGPQTWIVMNGQTVEVCLRNFI
jgi:hypothetical protein